MPMTDEQAHLKIHHSQGVHLVELISRKILEESSISQIGDQLSQLVEANPQIKLLLNFAQVEHLSSAALGMLITLRSKVEGTNGQLKLSDIRPQIYEVFKITQLYKLFDIHDSAAEALRRF